MKWGGGGGYESEGYMKLKRGEERNFFILS